MEQRTTLPVVGEDTRSRTRSVECDNCVECVRATQVFLYLPRTFLFHLRDTGPHYVTQTELTVVLLSQPSPFSSAGRTGVCRAPLEVDPTHEILEEKL